MHVASANAARFHAHQHLAASNGRQWKVCYFKVAVFREKQ
jgi:hypothetical protein